MLGSHRGRVLVSLLALLPACSAIITPDPGRLGGAMDAGVVGEVDAPIPPGTDAPVVVSDAPLATADTPTPSCAAGCSDGRVCVDGLCECPADACCPACSGDERCEAGACVGCGGDGESCCSSNVCDPGFGCVSGTCAPCGVLAGPCCGDLCDDGMVCADGTCVTPDCGTGGQPCCAGNACFGGFVCQMGFPFGSSCVTCGARDEPCCPGGTCDGDALACASGRCQACGDRFQPCCAGRCRSGTCNLGRCS